MSQLCKCVQYAYRSKDLPGLICTDSVQFQIKKIPKISYHGSLSPKYIELGHFTMLFYRRRQRNVPRFKTHVTDWTRFLRHRIKKYPDSPVHTLLDSLRIYHVFFPLWRADLFFSGFAVEFAGYVWTVAVSGKKKLRIQKYADTCGRGFRPVYTYPNSPESATFSLRIRVPSVHT